MSENVVNSGEATRKNPSQGKFKSGIQEKRPPMKIDVNKHGIRRETPAGPQAPKKFGRKKV
jgi:hypothetical protein